MQKISEARKAVAAALTGLVGWASAVVVSDPGPITAGEWVTLGSGAVAAFLVWWMPNEPASG